MSPSDTTRLVSGRFEDERGLTAAVYAPSDPGPTARLLETAEPALDVTIADSLTAGRRAVRDGSWACVVCDYQLGDGTGFDLVETVDGRHHYEGTLHVP